MQRPVLSFYPSSGEGAQRPQAGKLAQRVCVLRPVKQLGSRLGNRGVFMSHGAHARAHVGMSSR